MAMTEASTVLDISPWPEGHGFEGNDEWWDHVMRQDEAHRLDKLMGAALLDPDIQDRLVNQRDASLFTAFGLSQKTQQWLCQIRAQTLIELAQAIVNKTQIETRYSV
jgi:hypothetical protein